MSRAKGLKRKHKKLLRKLAKAPCGLQIDPLIRRLMEWANQQIYQKRTIDIVLSEADVQNIEALGGKRRQ